MAGNLDSEDRHSVSAGGQIRMCHPEVPPGTPVPDVRSEETSIPLGSESMPALVVFPEHTPAPAILVINDISGRSPFYDHLSRRIRQAGSGATKPEYFFRQGPLAEPTREAAGARAKKLDFVRWGDDMSAALDWLRARPGVNGTIGTIGFCMGGTQALLLAARRDDIAATVSYYGFPADARTSASPIDTAGRMHGPILGHWGDRLGSSTSSTSTLGLATVSSKRRSRVKARPATTRRARPGDGRSSSIADVSRARRCFASSPTSPRRSCWTACHGSPGAAGPAMSSSAGRC